MQVIKLCQLLFQQNDVFLKNKVFIRNNSKFQLVVSYIWDVAYNSLHLQ